MSLKCAVFIFQRCTVAATVNTRKRLVRKWSSLGSGALGKSLRLSQLHWQTQVVRFSNEMLKLNCCAGMRLIDLMASPLKNLYVVSVWNKIGALTRAVLKNECSLLLRSDGQDADIRGDVLSTIMWGRG